MTRVAHIPPIFSGGRPPEGRPVVPAAAWGAVGQKTQAALKNLFHSALKSPPLAGEGLGRGFSERDTETGYSYFGARYYSSDISVWLSVDPMGDKYPSMSAYMYCAGNPVGYKDPNGKWIEIIVTRYGLDGGVKKWFEI